MAITEAQLRGVLPGILVEPPQLKTGGDNRAFFYYPAPQTEWGEIRLLVLLQDGGRYIQFRSIDFFTLSENRRTKERQLEILLSHNYTRKNIQVGYDPEDGEVCLYVDLAILDNKTLSRKLMERVLGTIRISGAEILREMKLAEKGSPALIETCSISPLWQRLLHRVLRILYGRLIQKPAPRRRA